MTEYKNCIDYLNEMQTALYNNYINLEKLYDGKKGCLRLAREFGYGIPDSPKDEWNYVINNSYTRLCKTLYSFEPPINEKQWIDEIWKSINKRMQEQN